MDLLNTPFLSQARARNEMLDFLSKSLTLNEPAALLAITNEGIREIHPFTTDTKVLMAALRCVRGKVSPIETTGSDGNYLNEQELKEVAQEEGALAALEAKSNAVFNDVQQRNAIRSTMMAMEQVAQAYAGIPGRKTMLWATSGFPFLLDDPWNRQSAGTDMIHYYKHAWRAMSDANIAIYPITAEGLVNYEYERSFDVTRAGMRRGVSRMPSMDRYRLTVDSLRNFADATGGKACVDRNDLSKCFAEARQDSKQYYLMGFYLGSETRKPGCHKLKVQVNRERVTARSRSGYLVGDPKNGGLHDLEVQLATALISPLDYTGVAMDVRWLGQTQDNGKTKAQFAVKLPISAFTIDVTNKNAFSLRIAAMAFTLQGKPGPEISKVVMGNLKAESVAEITAGGFTYKDEISVPPGKYNVRFMIRDNQRGRLGTVSAPLEAK